MSVHDINEGAAARKVTCGLVGFSGAHGSGKGTCAAVLLELFPPEAPVFMRYIGHLRTGSINRYFSSFYTETDLVVLPDILSYTEAQFILDKGGVLINVFRPGTANNPYFADMNAFAKEYGEGSVMTLNNNGELKDIAEQLKPFIEAYMQRRQASLAG